MMMVNSASLKSILLIFLVTISTANADVYKGISSSGEVVYSDVPFRDSADFKAPPVTVLSMPDVILDKVLSEGAAKAEREAADKIAKEKAAEGQGEISKPADYKYTAFSIVSPTNEQTIRNNPDLEVKLSLKPSLNTIKKHVIWLLLDGEQLVDNSESLSIPTGRLLRGEHKLQAQVRDSKGKVIIKTKTIVVYIHNSSAN